MKTYSHTNTEGEKITISPSRSPEFKGKYCLVIWDDEPGNAPAPMLLDAVTRAWLVETLLTMKL